MINDDFIFRLEYILSLPNDRRLGSLTGCWCDGIFPTYELSDLSKIINNKRVIEMKMLYGKSGQEDYTLIIHFGKKSVSRNARGLDLDECIPDFAEDPGAISIDHDHKIVEIRMK